MNKLTSEQLRDRAERKVKNLKAVIEQSAFTSVHRRLDEELQLAEFALAAMNGEPVAWFVDFVYEGSPGSSFTKIYWSKEETDRWVRLHRLGGFDVEIQPLYTNPQPAPVVIRDHQIRGLVNILLDITIKYHGTQQLRGHIARVVREACWEFSKASFGDGWIPVTEQMPPRHHEVLVGCWWDARPRWRTKWATYIPGHPDALESGWLIPGASWTPTHWRPLPAAPQEINHD